VEVYPAVQRLATMLEIDFTYTHIRKENCRVNRITAYPETQLIGLLVIATKLSQPFDDIARKPESDADPTTARIDWEKWCETMAEEPSEGLKRGQEIKVTEKEILSMNGKKLDDYLDWYQKNMD
jgi:RNA polymerase I-specific transcription initiation factor RRN7